MANQSQLRSWLRAVILAASASLLIVALLWAMIWPDFLQHWPWPVPLVIASALSLSLALVGTHFEWPPQWLWLAVLVSALVMTSTILAIGTYLSRQLPWATAASILVLLTLPLILVLQHLRSTQWMSVLLVLLALAFYTGSLAYRAGNPTRNASYIAWTTPQVMDSTTGLSLRISHPRTVLLEAQGESRWPLSLHLWPPVLSSTPTPTTIKTPTVQTVLSYTVAFAPVNEGLIFTDKEGVPVPPNVQIGSGQTADKPAVLYLHRALTGAVPVSVPLTAYLYNSNGILQGKTSLEVQLEDAYSAWWRHLWGIVLGPTTPLLRCDQCSVPYRCWATSGDACT